MDDVLGRLERAGMQNCPPKLNPVKEAKFWLDSPGAPHAKLVNEKPKGETVPYEQLLQAWKEGRVK
jgi:glycerol transport system substrate-binding protein